MTSWEVAWMINILSNIGFVHGISNPFRNSFDSPDDMLIEIDNWAINGNNLLNLKMSFL